MNDKMLLGLLMAAAITLALPLVTSEEGRVIDLQELLLNVSDSYRDFEKGIKDLGSDITKNVQLIIQNVNVNAQRADANAKLLVENVKANSQHSDANTKLMIENVNQRLEANTDVLKQILEALGKKCLSRARDCSELFGKGERTNGKNVITLSGMQNESERDVEVFCDMKTDGGGWTVFQRRGQFGNPEDYFSRTWVEYKKGFGELEKEFWLGNDLLSVLTHQKEYVLRVDLWDLEENQVYAKYGTFKVENEEQKYRLIIAGYSGNAGDSMITSEKSTNLHGRAFTTKDRDNDLHPSENCAIFRGGGAWWFNSCSTSNLNGLNLKGGNDLKGIRWFQWKNTFYSMAYTEMKIRPANF